MSPTPSTNCTKSSRSQRVENITCRHPYPDRPDAGLHVGTRAATSGRQRRSAAGGGNYSAGHTTTHRDPYGTASACPDGYARTDDCGDPDNGTNCHANATNGDCDCATRGNTYRRAAYAHADANLAASPADGYGNDQHYHNGVARHGVGHPFKPSDLQPPRLEALDGRRRRLPRRPPRGIGGRKPDWARLPHRQEMPSDIRRMAGTLYRHRRHRPRQVGH